MLIFEDPRFFKILEGKDLDGKVCAECHEPFDSKSPYSFGYESKIDYSILSKGAVYHPECFTNYIFPVVNIPELAKPKARKLSR